VTDSFREKIRSWRGKRRQKECADLLEIKIRTLQAWEYGINEPDEVKQVEILRRMEAHKE
jgi:DNA-binding transcriptional regulator YiaG